MRELEERRAPGALLAADDQTALGAVDALAEVQRRHEQICNELHTKLRSRGERVGEDGE